MSQFIEKMMEVAEASNTSQLIDADNAFDLQAVYTAERDLFIIGFRNVLKPYHKSAIATVSEQSISEGHYQFKHRISRLCEGFEVYYEEINHPQPGMRDVNEIYSNVNQLHDAMTDLILYAAAIEEPTAEEVQSFNKAHTYFTKRKDLTATDLLVIREEIGGVSA
ncbi:hypothetical protein [Salinicoccus sp. CNSTN-B1]